MIRRHIHLKRKTNMSIDESILYKVDKTILETQVFGNRSEMFEYFSGFLDCFDESFKGIPVEKAIEKMYEKVCKSGLVNSDIEKPQHNKSKRGTKEQKTNTPNLVQETPINDTHQEIELGYIEKRGLTKEEQEIKDGISNFTGGFFK